MKVRIFSSLMGEKVIESSATNWGELKRDLSKANINYSGMKAVIGESQTTMEIDDSSTPQEDFTLFLMPKKTKSGGKNELSYKELRRNIKSAIEENPKAADFFNKGKNYTNKSTADLRKLWKKWEKKNRSSTTTATASTASPSTADSGVIIKLGSVNDTIKQIEDSKELDDDEFGEAREYLQSARDEIDNAIGLIKEAQKVIREKQLESQYNNLLSKF